MLFSVRKCYTERMALTIERKNAAAKVGKRKKEPINGERDYFTLSYTCYRV